MAIFSSIHKLVWFDGVVFVKSNPICWHTLLVRRQSQVLSFGDLPTLLYYKLVSSFLQILSSSFIMLRPLGLFFPTGNHLPISFVASLYLFSLQVLNLIFLGSLLSSILRICSLQFILYCVNLSLILKMPNCSLMSLLLILSQSVYPAIGLKNII